jgi:hypothetical protein
MFKGIVQYPIPQPKKSTKAAKQGINRKKLRKKRRRLQDGPQPTMDKPFPATVDPVQRLHQYEGLNKPTDAESVDNQSLFNHRDFSALAGETKADRPRRNL